MLKTAYNLLGVTIMAFTCLSMANAADPPIKVGAVLPRTGPQAEFGEIGMNSLLMGLDEINKAGGIKGRILELIIEDQTTRTDLGCRAVQKLISQDGVVALIGGYASYITQAMCELAQRSKVPFLVTTASADSITEQGWEYVFRLSPPMSKYTGALNSFLKEVVKPKTVAIIHANRSCSSSNAETFTTQCEADGIRVVLKQGFDPGTADFKPLLRKTKAAAPQMIYMNCYVDEAALLMRQAQELDLNAGLFVGGGARLTLPRFARNAGTAGDYVFSANLWTPSAPDPGAKAYSQNYRKRYGSHPEYHGAQAYAAIYLIADALNRAERVTPAEIRKALTETEMDTAFGPVKFISYGRKKQQNSPPTYLGQWQNGKHAIVWPRNAATRPYVWPVPKWSER